MQQTQGTSGTFLKTFRHPTPAAPGAAAEPSHIKVCRVDTQANVPWVGQRRNPGLGKRQSEIIPPIYGLMLTCSGDISRCLPRLKCRFDVDAGADVSGYTLANLGW
jgi:hypothetical protein